MAYRWSSFNRDLIRLLFHFLGFLMRLFAQEFAPFMHDTLFTPSTNQKIIQFGTITGLL